MQVMILAAGRSTRLGSLGLALPKPLLPVCGYPAITYALALCAKPVCMTSSSTCTTTATRSGRRWATARSSA